MHLLSLTKVYQPPSFKHFSQLTFAFPGLWGWFSKVVSDFSMPAPYEEYWEMGIETTTFIWQFLILLVFLVPFLWVVAWIYKLFLFVLQALVAIKNDFFRNLYKRTERLYFLLLINTFALLFPYALLQTHLPWWWIKGTHWSNYISLSIGMFVGFAALIGSIAICVLKIVKRVEVHNKYLKNDGIKDSLFPKLLVRNML